MEKRMKVSVNGEMQERRVVGYETSRDLLVEAIGLEALRYPITHIRPIPEIFEGERIIWYMDGSCEIITGAL
jgi:hypothetical protein